MKLLSRSLILLFSFLLPEVSFSQYRGGINDGMAVHSSCPVNLKGNSSVLKLDTISGAATFCSKGSKTYSVSVTSGYAERFYWIGPPGSIVVNGQGTKSAVIVFGTLDGKVKVEVSNQCEIDSVSQTVIADTGCTLYSGGINDGFAYSRKDSFQLIPCFVQAKVNMDTTICKGNSVKLTATGGIAYLWNTGNSSDTTASITVNPDTTTTYTVSVSDGKCSKTDSVKVIVVSLSANVTGNTIVCPGDSTTLTAAGGTKYVWNTKDSVASIKVVPLQDSTAYSVTVSNGGICPDTMLSIKIAIFDTASSIKGTTNICMGDSTVLTASAGNKYQWSTTDSTMSITVKPTTDATYTVKILNGKCSSNPSVKIVVTPYPVADAGKDTTVCAGENIQLSVKTDNYPSLQYQWTPTTDLSSSAISNPTATAVSTIKYFITVANGKCAVKDSVTITVNPLPVISVRNDTTINKGDSVVLSAGTQNFVSLQWKPSTYLNDSTIVNPTAKPTATIVYTVTGTDVNGCSNKDSVTITVRELECKEFFIPNAFSPNGNGFNDSLYVRGCLKEVTKATFSIYDRWGEKVFETADITKGWDGTYNGKALNTGVFVYYMKATLINGDAVEQKGNVSLIR